MAFRYIGEERSKMTGHFGSGQARTVHTDRGVNQKKQRNSTNTQNLNLRNITLERWIDIICMTLIFIFSISVLLNWNAFLDTMFVKVLFPIISVGAKLLGIIAGIGGVFGYIYAKLRRPRRWF